ncbi:MAG: iron ABC transporter permease [Oscillospiraceae bacterium]|nr:iron ABC transporter permease [Oscillospiraceae bacterium]MDD7294812.1 iron ABC transporter permease [Oscillospiraceae bacterium]MDY2509642.1 iron ABC transporter permease [Ruminococcus callidus]
MKQKRRIRYGTSYLLLIGILCMLFAVNLCSGSTNLMIQQVVDTLLHPDHQSTMWNILWEIRLPRILSAVILGGALSVSGFLLQNFFANPIAGPYILGISSGAKLTVAWMMVFFLGKGVTLSSAALVGTAFVGSMISMGFILLIAGKVRKMSLLIISGVMIGYICSAITDFVVTFAEDSNIVNLHNWSMGSFSGTSWSDIRTMTVVVATAFLLTFLLSKPMGAYQLGEVYAQNLGVPIRLFRVALILLSSILSACVTAFAGPISFVGIAVPHLVKSLFQTAKPIVVIPACFLGGSVFCLFCDLITRTVFAPTELSISSVTAIFGAPIVIWMMLRRDRKTKKGA